jgi:NAD(P)-dependent dehydrogenase (short-subunit alcohol dehydrogenase family)
MNLPPNMPRTALVTGAAKRIGRAIALDLARHGLRVGVHCGNSVDEACAVVSEIQGSGGQAVVLQADLAREADVQRLAAEAHAVLGPIGVLVNNASTFERDEIGDATRASWDMHLEANLRAPFVLIQEMARHLPLDGAGVVINLLDQRVWNLTPHFVSYTLSKAGLWTLTQTLALALAPRIRVNAIGPGPTLASVRQDPAQFERQVASVPLRAAPSLDEVCAAVRLLVSARSVTGQMLALDGGQHLNWGAPGMHQPDE